MKSAPKNLQRLAPSFKDNVRIPVDRKAQKKRTQIFVNIIKP